MANLSLLSLTMTIPFVCNPNPAPTPSGTEPQQTRPEQQRQSFAEKATRWDCTANERVVWRVKTAGENGFPVIHRGRILLGANSVTWSGDGPRATMSCYSAATGALLWQADHAPLPNRYNDMPGAVFARPSVDGDRGFYVSNRGELVCVDLNGFGDGKIAAPTRAKLPMGAPPAKVVWTLDMVSKLGVYKRDAFDVCNPLPGTLVAGDLVLCITGNGNGPRFDHVPRPDAPSFLAAEKASGKVVWSSNAPGKEIVYGQWSAPVLARVGGQTQVIFPGGDGRLYAFEPATGRLLWKFDCGPAPEIPPGLRWRSARDFFVGVPVVHEDMLYFGLSLEPEAGPAAGRPLWALDLRRVAESPAKAVRWKFVDPDFGGTFGSPAVADDVLFTVGATEVLFALDRRTGKELWRSYLDDVGNCTLLSSPCVHGDNVLIGTQDGSLYVFEASRKKKCLGFYVLGDSVQAPPVLEGDVVYVSTRYSLWALRL